MTELTQGHGCGPDCGCGDDNLARRDFLRTAAVSGATALALGRMPVMAGPFADVNDYLRLIPADKKLDPAWVKSLFERGTKQTYRNRELAYIGMPVGGIGAGMVYLGGDGRLWLWDIFNKQYPRGLLGKGAGGETYIHPLEQVHPFTQGFSLRVRSGTKAQHRALDCSGFSDVTFDGRYPMGMVSYRDAACPVEVQLEAFSPFVPLDLSNSSYPAVILRYTVRNAGATSVTAGIAGWTDNPVCLYTGRPSDTLRRNRVVRTEAMTVLECRAEAPAHQGQPAARPDILFEDFEKPTYEGWESTGTAFGSGPAVIADIPDYQGDVAGVGKRVVNSHATAPGGDVGEKDSAVGTLTSREFTIERRFVTFRIGGGNHPGRTEMQLLVDGKPVRAARGRANNRMQGDSFDVANLQGRKARLRIVDQESSGWGNIGIDQIVFSDHGPKDDTPLESRHDYGSFALGVSGAATHAGAVIDLEKDGPKKAHEADAGAASAGAGSPLVGSLSQEHELAPGASKTITFVVAWHFPNLHMPAPFGNRRMGRHYAARFADAPAVAGAVADALEPLYRQTRRWVDTWYDSTLPYWLLDRTMANTSTLATSTCYLFENGRFYGWEGINCCPGTCAHVWHYAQAPGRLFPEIERDVRRRVDFGLALGANGAIHYRGELHAHHADDGQCGRILGVLREHQMSTDSSFLEALWPKVKRAVEFMMQRDAGADGILDGAQPNTLDAAWYGQISFTSSLYLAALKAGEQMAREMGDSEFADRCRAIADTGATSILGLYNGEYFIQHEDPKHRNQIGVGPGCYIDQIFGQTWAHWVGLGYLFDRDKQLSALRALWRYNFLPDVGPFRKHFKRGRWYAQAGDAGLIMCSWPKGGRNPGFEKHWQYQYFNECMTGFEWQAAAQMIWEGHDQKDLLQYGLAVARAIHDRYDAKLRNPYNEIECSDHYARAMASYGAYQAVCGFNCHGPSGHVEWAPRLHPKAFRAAFTSPAGWGSLAQSRRDGQQQNTIAVQWGTLMVRSLAVTLPSPRPPARVTVHRDGQEIAAAVQTSAGKLTVQLATPVTLGEGQELTVTITTV